MNSAQTPSSPIVVLVTTGSVEEARAIARLLIQQRLAACVNFFPIQSVYHWNDEIQEDAEFQLLIKTDGALFKQLENTIKANHTYDLPEIISLEIRQGSQEYLSWISGETKHKP